MIQEGHHDPGTSLWTVVKVRVTAGGEPTAFLRMSLSAVTAMRRSERWDEGLSNWREPEFHMETVCEQKRKVDASRGKYSKPPRPS